MTRNSEIVIKVTVKQIIVTAVSFFFAFSVPFGTSVYTIYKLIEQNKDENTQEHTAFKADINRLNNSHKFESYCMPKFILRGHSK